MYILKPQQNLIVFGEVVTKKLLIVFFFKERNSIRNLDNETMKISRK